MFSNDIRLSQGMRLSHKDFIVCYEKSGLRKVELINGRVQMPSPVNHAYHGGPHGVLATWLGVYASFSQGVDMGVDSSVNFSSTTELQPDLLLRKMDGNCSRDERGNLSGPPELLVEISSTSFYYDAHEKKEVYRRSGVQEYIIWRPTEKKVDWFKLENSIYKQLDPVDGFLRSEVFPGLVLNVTALNDKKSSEVLVTLMNSIH